MATDINYDAASLTKRVSDHYSVKPNFSFYSEFLEWT